MATNKTIQPSGETIVVPDFDEKPDARTFAQDISKLADNDNSLNQAISNKTYPVSSGTIVSANDDFNSFITPGVYTVSSNAIAQSVGNCPIANAGRLCVWSPTSNALNSAWAVGEQMYYAPANNGVYKRRSVADGSGNITWGAWQQLALNSDLMTPEAITLTAASDVTLASTSKAYKIGKFIVVYAKGSTTQNIINGNLFSVSSGRNALFPMTFAIGIGSEWDITSVGYGFVSGNNFLGNVPVNKWFHLYVVYLYA